MHKKSLLGIVAAVLVTGVLFAEEATIVKEDWDWAGAMLEVAKKGKGKNKEGVVLTLGDSISYANQSTAWGRSAGRGGTPEDKAILKWTHAGKRNDQDGWYLASLDAPGGGRSETAASGVRTDQYIRGGHYGLSSLKDILKRYKPQMTFILLGTNDSSANRKPEDVARDMATIIQTILDNGTIPVLQTLAPMRNDRSHENVKKYNALYLKIAKEKKIPIVDLYGEFLTRAPNGAWKTVLLSDGVHFTHEQSGGPPTKENLARCGYLLRCWLSVQKIKDVKREVIDKM